jgi:hypothetical protein
MKTPIDQLLEEVLKIEASGSAEPEQVTAIINEYLKKVMDSIKEDSSNDLKQ